LAARPVVVASIVSDSGGGVCTGVAPGDATDARSVPAAGENLTEVAGDFYLIIIMVALIIIISLHHGADDYNM